MVSQRQSMGSQELLQSNPFMPAKQSRNEGSVMMQSAPPLKIANKMRIKVSLKGKAMELCIDGNDGINVQIDKFCDRNSIEMT